MTNTLFNWCIGCIDWCLSWKGVWAFLGGIFGWFVAEFQPTFPLMIVVIILILYDAWTAYQLDQRVHLKYPDKTKREKAHFTSFAFGKVIRQTIPKRLWLIILAFIVEHWIFVHVSIPLSYVVAGAIAFEQGLSILENEASCRDTEQESRFWKVLHKILIDKTERHFEVDLHDLRDIEGEKGEETQKQNNQHEEI